MKLKVVFKSNKNAVFVYTVRSHKHGLQVITDVEKDLLLTSDGSLVDENDNVVVTSNQRTGSTKMLEFEFTEEPISYF